MVFVLVVAVLIIPQTRKPIQIFLNKGMALISPSVESKGQLTALKSYNWKLMDETGHVFNFEQIKGKVVLINFWATWCPPCIAEMPGLQKLYNDYHNGIVFLFVTTDRYEVVDEFLKKNAYTFKVYRPLNGEGPFEVPSIPRTFLIDRKGNIVIDESGAANWNSDKVRTTIDGLLKQ